MKTINKMKKFQNVNAIILAGGKSKRMGQDKAFLNFPEGNLISRVYRQLLPYFNNILVSVSKANAGKFQDYKIIIDEHENAGPLIGILSSLKKSDREKNFFIATDIPNSNLDVLHQLISLSSEYEIVVPKSEKGFLEPLFAVYSKSIIPKINNMIKLNNFKIINLYPFCNTGYVKTIEENQIKNLNSNDEYLSYLKNL